MTKLERLEQVKIKQGLRKDAPEYIEVYQALYSGAKSIRTAYTTGSGKRTRTRDITRNVAWILSAMKIEYEVLNDAPRGGVLGNYISIPKNRPSKEFKNRK